jgi:hypothetical protein
MKHNSRSVLPFQYSSRSHSSLYLSSEWYAAELAGPSLKRDDRTMNNEGRKQISRVSLVFCLCLIFKPEIKKIKLFSQICGNHTTCERRDRRTAVYHTISYVRMDKGKLACLLAYCCWVIKKQCSGQVNLSKGG